MNREQFNNIYNNGFTPNQKKVLTLFLEGQSENQIMEALDITDRTGISSYFRKIYERFGSSPENRLDRYKLLELFAKYKHSLVNPEVFKKYGFNVPKILLPEGPEPLKSPFYIERDSVEDNCFQAIKNS